MSAVDLASTTFVILGAIGLGYLVAAIVIFIVSVSNSREPDPRGSRPMAAYYYSAAFLFMWITFIFVVRALDSLINLVGNHPATFFPVSYTNIAIRDGVIGVLFLVFAGGAYSLHVRRGNVLADTEDEPSGPTKRIMRSYVAVTSFASVLIFVAAFIAAIYYVCQLISPTIFGGSHDRTVVARQILDAGILIILSGMIFSFHQRFAPSSLRLLGFVGHQRRRHHRYPAPHDTTPTGEIPPTPPAPPAVA